LNHSYKSKRITFYRECIKRKIIKDESTINSESEIVNIIRDLTIENKKVKVKNKNLDSEIITYTSASDIILINDEEINLQNLSTKRNSFKSNKDL